MQKNYLFDHISIYASTPPCRLPYLDDFKEKHGFNDDLTKVKYLLKYEINFPKAMVDVQGITRSRYLKITIDTNQLNQKKPKTFPIL